MHSLVFVQSVGERDRTFLVSLPEAKPTVLLERRRRNEVFYPTSWSADGRYLWMAPPGPPEPPFILDLSTKRTTTIRGEPREGVPEYRRFPGITLLAWLRVP